MTAQAARCAPFFANQGGGALCVLATLRRPHYALRMRLRRIAFAGCGLVSGSATASDTFEGHTFWIGDPHAHTGLSGDAAASDLNGCDQCGALTDVFTNARAAGLDWVALSDHVNGGFEPDPATWAAFQATVVENNDPEGGLLTIPAAEVWLANDGGHFFGHVTFMAFGTDEQLGGLTIDEVRPAGGPLATIADCETWWDQLGALSARRGPVLSLPHHPAHLSPAAWDWACFDEEYTPAVEVYSEHGTSMGDGVDFDPPWSERVDAGTVHAAMDPDGWARRLSFFGGSDEHDTWPGSVCDADQLRTVMPYGGGLTMVVTEDGAPFDRSAIYGAFAAGRTYATSGPAIPVVVAWHSGGAVLGEMGTDVGLPTGQALGATVLVPAVWAPYVTTVELVSPDTRLALDPAAPGAWEGELPSDEVAPWVYVAVRIDGAAAFGDSCADGGTDSLDWAWLSPSWVTRVPPDLGGDGVAALDGDCDDGDATLFPGADDAPGDGIDQDCDGLDANPPDDSGIPAGSEAGPTAVLRAGGDCGCDSATGFAAAWPGTLAAAWGVARVWPVFRRVYGALPGGNHPGSNDGNGSSRRTKLGHRRRSGFFPARFLPVLLRSRD